jgi:hypothetical protein
MSMNMRGNVIPFGAAAVAVVVLSLAVLLIARPGGDNGGDIVQNPTTTPAVAGETATPIPGESD